jgi:hypothetical protein
MRLGTFRRLRRHLVFSILVASLGFGGLAVPTKAQPQEPIAYIGHGSFFDSDGNAIVVTQAFAEKAQDWYRQTLIADLPADKKAAFASLEAWLGAEFQVSGQARLVVRHRGLEWLVANSAHHRTDHQMLGKLRALAFALQWKLPDGAGLTTAEGRQPFALDPDVSRKLEAPPGDAAIAWKSAGTAALATVNLGQAYINECIAQQVPIPPPINRMDAAGLTGWKSQGFIPMAEQFIGQEAGPSPAEVRTFSSPQGMCIALPRYSNPSMGTVVLDGVICLSKITSKVCFWDNQMGGSGFSFPAGTQIPIGVADLAIDPSGRYQAGGFELLGGTGGVCTDCHAGENPYIVHPDSNLGRIFFGDLKLPPQSLPTFAPNRYDPIVASAWPQNQLSQTFATSPTVCTGCHVKGDAGRFPHLSNQLPGYCGTVLRKAILQTMPPFDPGGEAGTPEVANFRSNWCGDPPNSSSADTGDPHITTTNGVHYDFQAAGEFVALRNPDSGFELQTRQSPVLTNFVPGANSYTGLSSCVSLNTAVALRIGRRRVTVQPSNTSFANLQELVLRVDGERTDAAQGVDLGGGNSILKRTKTGDIDIRLVDGTRIIVTPLFWSSQGYWYLDVQVLNTPAREGVMGHISAPDWLPRAPDGSGWGSRPAALADRHIALNQKFADFWRVTRTTSLFDYSPGTSTATFTDRNWPSPPGQACTSTTVPGSHPRVKEPRPDLAKKACRGIRDPEIFANCVFDVTVMGDATAARGHKRADQLH